MQAFIVNSVFLGRNEEVNNRPTALRRLHQVAKNPGQQIYESAYGDPEIGQDVPKSVSGNAKNHHAPVINIDPGVESGVLLRVPDLPFSRGTSSAESLGATPNQFLNLPSPAEHRRHSMQDGRSPHNHHHHRRHRDRKRSCPDVRSSADRRRRGSRSPMAPQGLTVTGGVDSMSVTPSSSRRSSASSLSRRSSRDSECCAHSRRSSRADDGSRRFVGEQCLSFSS
ncbi:uncharacterized protein [Dermacentor albipictus]|uniref:uncharacterized protein n=1 Tax=Dermacentor albipictus TaxID=60249 RepID=UPI0038FC80DD